MIPVSLKLQGFLSYRQPVELDFTGLDLACISGPNGAGKSSLLDAITWALFGQARKRDESLINMHPSVSAAEVTFIFDYEGNRYRVTRTNPRGKTGVLEFNILSPGGEWKVLSERTLRETQVRIEQTLRMDYETFINASFFLQGKADQFTQQRPGDRKRILSSVLGLEIWEQYREQAVANRRKLDERVKQLDGRLAEIDAELAQEQSRKERLKVLEQDLERQSAARQAGQAALEAAQKVAATLSEQEKLLAALARQLENANKRLDEMERRLQQRQQESRSFHEIIARAEQVQADYNAWQQARADLERWEAVAESFRKHEKRRQAPLSEIERTAAGLQKEIEGLLREQSAAQAAGAELAELQPRQKEAYNALELAEISLSQRLEIQEKYDELRDSLAETRAENPRLKAEMKELKERINSLVKVESAECPLCGKPLDPVERQNLIVQLEEQGTSLGDRYRSNHALMQELEETAQDFQAQLDRLSKVDEEVRQRTKALEQINARIEQQEAALSAWQSQRLPHLERLQQALATGEYAEEARQTLAQVDAELKAIGYDAVAHDQARQRELAGRQSEAALRSLERAQASLQPLEREIGELTGQIELQQQEVARQRTEHDEAAASLAAAQVQAPDLFRLERELQDSQLRENRLRMEVGAAQQSVLVLDELRARKLGLEQEREGLALRVARYKQLERAFSKDGVPALLIEQALPQIEAKANEILDRLSAGGMSVRFETQAKYKDTRRDDLRETLEIKISDGAGVRDYELFSGGEAFRVNFAIRLALSEVLAQRAGARLQTLVIDEGFGSQDAQGRQRLVEAINLVRPDFAKILVITHIDELKEAFPNRIEVEKTPSGSTVRVT